MSEWQPIETAPTDVPVLVWDRRTSHCRAAQLCTSIEDGDQAWVYARRLSIEGEPALAFIAGDATHWMPLPEPPATKGSRELDRAIHLAVHGEWMASRGIVEDGDVWRDPEYGKIALQDYTTSVDTALTLVPEGWRVYALEEHLGSPTEKKWFAGLDNRSHQISSQIGRAPTPALALCIAALKARKAT